MKNLKLLKKLNSKLILQQLGKLLERAGRKGSGLRRNCGMVAELPNLALLKSQLQLPNEKTK